MSRKQLFSTQARYNSEFLFSVLVQSKSLVAKKEEPMDVKEYEVFLSVFLDYATTHVASLMY
jgi:hypothetical protein